MLSFIYAVAAQSNVGDACSVANPCTMPLYCWYDMKAYKLTGIPQNAIGSCVATSSVGGPCGGSAKYPNMCEYPLMCSLPCQAGRIGYCVRQTIWPRKYTCRAGGALRAFQRQFYDPHFQAGDYYSDSDYNYDFRDWYI